LTCELRGIMTNLSQAQKIQAQISWHANCYINACNGGFYENI